MISKKLYENFSLDLKGYAIVLLDTQVKHSLASLEYNIRCNECELGVSSACPEI
jgi:galactokinase